MPQFEGEALSETLSRTVLHRGSGARLYDVRCRSGACAPGAEEHTDETQIVFPRRGVFVRHLGKRALVADPNQVLFFVRGDVYRVSHPRDARGDDCTVLAVDDALLAEALGAPERASEVLRAPQRLADAQLGYALARLGQSLLDPRAERLATDAIVLDLLAASVQRSPTPTRSAARRTDTEDAQRALVERVKVVLSSRFADDLTLEALAHTVHTSPWYLSRTFQRHAGLGLHRYRTRLRLAHGLARLVDGERDLARLARELGFSSHSHFSDVFRRAFGVAPSLCRRTLSARQLRALSKDLTVAHGPTL